jgi:hypothetical protein
MPVSWRHSWLSFHDLFIAVLHNNGALSGAEKLQYLKAHVKGEPALLLQSITVTDSNYAEAWKLLNECYQDKREPLNVMLKRLFVLQLFQRESDSTMG